MPELLDSCTDASALAKELKELRLAYKKQSRQLEKALILVERNRVAAMSKDNLSRIIASDKSMLERYMNLLLENSPDIIMLFDQEGRIAYCTEVFLARGRIPAFGVITGKSYREFLEPMTPPGFIDRMDEMFSHIHLKKQAVEMEEAIDFGMNGYPLNYSIQLAPMLDADGGHAGAIAFFHDITDIIRAKQEAVRANEAKSNFLATVSHEIRTPLNAIIGLSDMMKSSHLDNNQSKLLEGIQHSSHVLLSLINDLLDFSKIDAGKLDLIEEYFSLAYLLDQLQSMFAVMFAQKGLTLTCEFSDDLPQTVFGDEKRVGQILTNLINNALKYTEHGGVVFRAFLDKGKICMEVEDTGIGIRQNAIPKLFTAFEQLDLVRNKNVVGTGLGLAITKKLCELMNGLVEVESEYGKGSIFRVRLPLKGGEPMDLHVLSASEPIRFQAPEAKVLLVDDIDINLQIAAFMLSTFEICPDTAVNGQQAVEMAKKNQYDLILMDHMMPEMDGMEAVSIIRSLEGPIAHTPIVALTANAVNEAKNMFLQNGFDGFLSKPIEMQELTDILLKWLPSKYLTESKH